jgi:hypothetical protein
VFSETWCKSQLLGLAFLLTPAQMTFVLKQNETADPLSLTDYFTGIPNHHTLSSSWKPRRLEGNDSER